MTYEPQPGDIGLIAIGGQVGKAIRVGQFILAKLDDIEARNDEEWANYQHAFVYLGNGMLIEAEPGGARIRPLSEYDGAEIYWCQNISHGLTAQQRNAVAMHAQALLGTPYSFIDYLALTAHKLHIPVPGLKDYIASTGHVICSQLAAWAYDRSGVTLFHGRWPGDVDPLDLFLLDRQIESIT